ncbi:hypothetical protein B0H14DRAFT_3566411 [Mycena olivaceomarginata]|nr:hypothetical protein B0H14DRAFT_3566411 [Mycena olivaceomarginata]
MAGSIIKKEESNCKAIGFGFKNVNGMIRTKILSGFQKLTQSNMSKVNRVQTVCRQSFYAVIAVTAFGRRSPSNEEGSSSLAPEEDGDLGDGGDPGDGAPHSEDDGDGDHDSPRRTMADTQGKYIDEVPQSPKVEDNSYCDGDVAGSESTMRAPWALNDERDSAEQEDNGGANALWDFPAKPNVNGKDNGGKTRPQVHCPHRDKV